MEMFLKMVAPFLTFVGPVLVRIAKFNPYFHLTNKDGTPYMNRYWLVKPSKFTRDWGIRIHEILSSDDDRALHDHPWAFYSVILKEGYREIVAAYDNGSEAHRAYYDNFEFYMWSGYKLEYEIETTKWVIQRRLKKGDVNANKPGAWHRLRLNWGPEGTSRPATTLFISGPKVANWGFMVDGKKVPWREYISKEFGKDHVTATEAKLKEAFGTSRVSK